MSLKIVATTDVHGSLLAYDFVKSSISKKRTFKIFNFSKKYKKKIMM